MSDAVDAFLSISEVDDPRIGEPIFRRKFGGSPPDVPHHVVTFFHADDGALWPASYVHFRPFGDIILVGGASTDGRVLARMSETQRNVVTREGGLYLKALRWAFARYAAECEAYFGYCGDPRAREVDLAAGFVDTGHPNLLAHFHKPVHDVMRRALTAKAHAIGPF